MENHRLDVYSSPKYHISLETIQAFVSYTTYSKKVYFFEPQAKSHNTPPKTPSNKKMRQINPD